MGTCDISNINYLKTYGKKLVRLGYNIIPIAPGCKNPRHLKNWQKIQATTNDVNGWMASPQFNGGGVGVLTANTPAVDLDVLSPQVALQLIKWCETNIGKTIVRVGKRPKSLLLFKTDTPFKKRVSNIYLDAEGRRNAIEILGDGQQCVVYGTHPDTEMPYKYTSDIELTDIDAEDLPVITQEHIDELFKFFELIKPTSWRLKRLADSSKNILAQRGFDEAELYLTNHKSPKSITQGDIESALEQISAESYDDWVRVGMALNHQYNGGLEGFDIWDKWSSTAYNYEPSIMSDKWETFNQNGHARDCVTIDSIFYLAKSAKSPAEGFEWRADLAQNKNGGVIKSPHNVQTIFENDPKLKGVFYYDMLLERICLRRNPFDDKALAHNWLQDSVVTDIYFYLSREYGTEFPKNLVHDVIEFVAHQDEHHPIKDYLLGVEWDGTERLEELWIKYLGADDNAYSRQTAKVFMTAAVARVFEPGRKFDTMPIISGAQGVGKSLFVKTLCPNPEWFGENLETLDGKEAAEAMMGKWLIEMAEIDALTKSSVRRVKAFLSRTDDSVRLAYGRNTKRLLRQCVFVGTDNYAENLVDTTGNRRFWPISCTQEVDIATLVAERDQLWAEAYQSYLAGTNLYLDRDVESIAKTKQRDAMVADEWEGVIVDWLDGVGDVDGFDDLSPRRNYTCIAEIKRDCLRLDPHVANDRRASDRIAGILNNLDGWQRGNGSMRFNGYGKQRFYERIK